MIGVVLLGAGGHDLPLSVHNRADAFRLFLFRRMFNRTSHQLESVAIRKRVVNVFRRSPAFDKPHLMQRLKVR
jgi:hypothetical protein